MIESHKGKGLGNKNAYGSIPWNKGKKLSKEHIRKLVLSHTGKKQTKEWIEMRSKLVIPSKDTSIELKIQSLLRLLHVEFVSHYNISKITCSYNCDIFIPSTKTIIECDGCYWHGCPFCFKNLNNAQKKQVEKDNIRTKELLEKGYRVIRLWEHNIRSISLNKYKKLFDLSQ